MFSLQKVNCFLVSPAVEGPASFANDIKYCLLSLMPMQYSFIFAVEVIETVPSVHLCVGVCGTYTSMLCATSIVQSYIVHHRPALCTTDLHCAPLHVGDVCDIFHVRYQLALRWCTMCCCQSG